MTVQAGSDAQVVLDAATMGDGTTQGVVVAAEASGVVVPGGIVWAASEQVWRRLRSINWDLNKLQPFEKNFYIEHPDVANRSDEDAARWRRDHNIVIQGQGIPK
eukprot:24877-Eustigmatos_ZCMA.PRE.1